MVEVELERLLGPYSHDTRLVIKRLRDDKREEVPNYGGMFDFWRLDENLLERSWDKFIALDIQYLIYADLWADDEDDEEDADALKGYPVFRASEIPLDSPHDGIVTPDGRYHDFWTGENKENRELAERLIKEHGDCLAVLCSAHV